MDTILFKEEEIMKQIRAGSVQFQHVPGVKEKNLQKISTFIQKASRENVEIIAFPEMCITGYWHVRKLCREEIQKLSEPVPTGSSSLFLVDCAKKYNIIIGAGLIEQGEKGNLYNSYVVAMPDGRVACHRKIHCFISKHMSCGNSYTVFEEPRGTRVGVLTCYDNNIIENVRITALMGAEILLAPHQTGGCKSVSSRCMGLIDPELWHNRKQNPEKIEAEFRGSKGRGWLMRWLPSRAHDNGLFILFSNGVGIDDNEVRTGNAMILDPYGEILTETGRAEDAMVIADLDPEIRKDSSGYR